MLNPRKALVVVVALMTPALFSISGCKNEEEVIDSATPSSVAFEGEVDPALVGKWKATDGTSKYQFEKDGKFELEQRVTVRGAAQGGTVQGKWKVKDGQLLIQDSSGNVVPYAMERKGDQVMLSLTGSLKNKTTLERE